MGSYDVEEEPDVRQNRYDAVFRVIYGKSVKELTPEEQEDDKVLDAHRRAVSILRLYGEDRIVDEEQHRFVWTTLSAPRNIDGARLTHKDCDRFCRQLTQMVGPNGLVAILPLMDADATVVAIIDRRSKQFAISTNMELKKP